MEDAALWEQAVRLGDLLARPDLLKDRGQYLSEQMMLGKWYMAPAIYRALYPLYAITLC